MSVLPKDPFNGCRCDCHLLVDGRCGVAPCCQDAGKRTPDERVLQRPPLMRIEREFRVESVVFSQGHEAPAHIRLASAASSAEDKEDIYLNADAAKLIGIPLEAGLVGTTISVIFTPRAVNTEAPYEQGFGMAAAMAPNLDPLVLD